MRETPSKHCVSHYLIYVAETGDIKASVAMLGFIFSSAAKHNVDSESLSSELQQLGLPKGESTTLIVFLSSLEERQNSCNSSCLSLIPMIT